MKSCFQGYVLSSRKILYFFLEKKNVNTVSGLFRNQIISFCCRLFTRAKFSDAAREEAVDDIKNIYIYKLDVRLDSLALPLIRD